MDNANVSLTSCAKISFFLTTENHPTVINIHRKAKKPKNWSAALLPPTCLVKSWTMLCSDTWEPMAKRLFSCFSTREIISWSSCEVKPSTPEEEKIHIYIWHIGNKQKQYRILPAFEGRCSKHSISRSLHHELQNSKMCLFSLHNNTVKVKVQLLSKVRHSVLYHPDISWK